MYQLFNCNLSDKPKLAPPWYIVYRDIKSTVGADSFVHVQELREIDEFSFLLEIFVDDPGKAQALANVLLNEHQIGDVTLALKIIDLEGNDYYPQPVHDKSGLQQALETAFASNDLFYGVEDGARMRKTWAVIIAKSVLQYYNDDLTDLYANNNEPAAEIFKRILRLDYDDKLSICVTTDLDRNVDPLDNQKMSPNDTQALSPPWMISYYLIKSFLGVDPSLLVRPMYQVGNSYFIDVLSLNSVKAGCLARIMKTRYDYGNVQLYVRFFDLSLLMIASPIEVRGKDIYKAVTRVIKKAFALNPLIKNVFNLHGLVPEQFEMYVGNIVVVAAKEVIQVYASNIQDLWGNNNYVAAAALREIMDLEYLFANTEGKEVRVRLNTTTEYDRDVLN